MIPAIEISNAGAGRERQVNLSSARTREGGLFASMFDAALRGAPGAVRFSAHAQQRLSERGVDLSAKDLARISRAIQEADAKGARETLLVMNPTGSGGTPSPNSWLALVVDVPSRTVITLTPTREWADTVFTQIDSAVVLADAPTAK